jgi:protein TonB
MFGSIVLALLIASTSATAQTSAAQQPPAVPSTSEQPWPAKGVERIGAGITPPRLIKETKPQYTVAAMTAKIQGSVVVEVIVGTNGTITDVRVKRSLDRQYGLDDAAVAAVKKWSFAPGRKNNVAVPVLVEIELTFTLRG